MAIQPHRLTFVLGVASSDVGTKQQTVTIATDTADEAVELARFYLTGLASELLVSATLTDASGAVIWPEQANSVPDEAPLQRNRT